MLSFLRNIIQLILSPAHGWEEISYEGDSAERLAARGMYPLMAIVAVSEFAQGIYAKTIELGALLQSAIAQFCSLLAAYYIGVALFDVFIGRMSTSEVSANKIRTIAIYTVSLLSLIQIIENLVPIEIIILRFLPAFVAIVLWRAKAYLSISKEKEGIYILFAISALIIPWFIVKTLLTFIL